MRQPGDRVAHYVIRALLGRGGMGEVYEAEDVRLGRRVALKLIPSGADDDASERMLREARAAAGFDHRNVVLVLDVGVVTEGEGAGETYLAMELVRGRTLRAMIRERDVSLGKKVRWLVDVARALAAGHEAGLVHRDIKPDNLMVRDDGVIKVLDFGIAKRSKTVDPSAPTEAGLEIGTLTKAGAIVGTPRYASPEQLRGDPIDGRADQYAWGATAYELLSGKPPFEADDTVALLSRVLSTEAPALAIVAPEVPKEIADVVMKTLAKRADDRFPSLSAVADALEPFADAEHASSDRTTSRTRAAKTDKTVDASAPESVVVRAAKTSFRVFFWIAAGLGTLIIVALAAGAVTGKLRFDTGASSRGSAAPSASASAGPLASARALRCVDAKISGEGASPELAHLLGVGACTELAVVTGREWGHEKAAEQGLDLVASPTVDVRVTMGTTTEVCVSVGDAEVTGRSTSPVDAMTQAVAGLAPKLGTPPIDDAARGLWGTETIDGARRVEQSWRRLLVGHLKDPEAEARALVKSDGDSPWPHAILGLVAVRGSKTSLDALAEADRRLDKLSGARKRALGALVGLLSKPNPEETMRELRKAYDDAPDDADVAGLYAAIAISLVPSEEGFAVVDRLAERFPTRAILALQNAVTAAPRRDLDRDARYLGRLVDILPDAVCFDIVMDHRLAVGDVEGARAMLATCSAYYGSASNEHGLDLREARIALMAGEPERAHDIAAKRLGDPHPYMRAEAAQYVIGSFLAAGRIAEAEDTLVSELKRERDGESSLLALRHAQILLRTHRRLGTKPPDEIVSWLGESLAKASFLPERGRLSLRVDLALARPSDTKEADAVLEAYDKLNDPASTLTSLPLVRARKGDKAAVELFRASSRASDGSRMLVAVDAALALLSQHAPLDEIEQALAPLSSPDALGVLALDRVLGHALRARALAGMKRSEEEAKEKAWVDHALSRCDKGVRATLDALR